MSDYKGVADLKQLPQCRPDYKGKNSSGGRKAVFAQSQTYHKRPSVALPWSWITTQLFILETPTLTDWV